MALLQVGTQRYPTDALCLSSLALGSWQVSQRLLRARSQTSQVSFPLGLARHLETNPQTTQSMNKEPDRTSPPGWANPPVTVSENSTNHSGSGIVGSPGFGGWVAWGKSQLEGGSILGSILGIYLFFILLEILTKDPEWMIRMKRALGSIIMRWTAERRRVLIKGLTPKLEREQCVIWEISHTNTWNLRNFFEKNLCPNPHPCQLVTLDKLLYLSVPWFPQHTMGIKTAASQDCR